MHLMNTNQVAGILLGPKSYDSDQQGQISVLRLQGGDP